MAPGRARKPGGCRCRRSRPSTLRSPASAMAYVLAGGRGSRLHGTDRSPRQARGLFRRQVAHHRLRAVERAQFRHPPHRRRDPVQGAQPDPPPAARLELLPPRAQRELRHPAGQPARLRDPVVCRHRRCGLSEHRHHRRLRAAIHRPPGGRPCLQDGLRADAAAACRARRRRDRGLHRGAAQGRDRLRRDARRRRRPASPPSWKSPPTRRACRAIPTWRWPAWASTSSRPISCSTSCGATPPIRIRAHDFGNDIIPYLVRHGKRGRAPLRRSLRALHRRGGGLLARRRHGRRLLGGQYRPHRRRPGARPLRPRLADLDLCRDHAAGEVRP